MLGARLEVRARNRQAPDPPGLRAGTRFRGRDHRRRRLHRREDLMSTLTIRDLHVSIEAEGVKKPILKGVDLTINQGEIHAVMGPNGSGKSTLAYTVAGHPRYQVDGGSIELDGEDVLSMSVDERARAGLFLAMQYPVEIPGVTVAN